MSVRNLASLITQTLTQKMVAKPSINLKGHEKCNTASNSNSEYNISQPKAVFAHHYLRAEALSGVAPHCLTVREERRGAMGEDRRAVNACIQSGGQGR